MSNELVDTQPSIRIGNARSVPVGGRIQTEINGVPIVVLNENGNLFAIGRVCPHRDGPLEQGAITEGRLRCPWHGMAFDLETGQSEKSQDLAVPTFDIDERDDGIWVAAAARPTPERLRAEYLVRYGKTGIVAGFATDPKGNTTRLLSRGDRVIIESDRGTEMGEILLADSRSLEGKSAIGTVLRQVNPADITTEMHLHARHDKLFDSVQSQITSIASSVDVVDSELLFDGETLLLYFLGHANEDLGRASGELGESSGVRVQFEPLIEPSGGGGGCGSGGCGSEGCGSGH